jgi:hypothetical protein
LKRIPKGFETLALQYFSTWKMFHTRLPAETEIKKKINLFSVVLDLAAGLISFINTMWLNNNIACLY